MKYLIVVLEGAASPANVGKTPLQLADTPELKRLARRGQIGALQLQPEEVRLPFEASYLTLLGYEPRQYSGRGPVIASALRVTLAGDDVAFCCPLIATDGTQVLAGTLDALSDDDCLTLMTLVSERLQTRRLAFYPAPQNRSLLTFASGPTSLSTVSPMRITGKAIHEVQPTGDEAERLVGLYYDSLELLADHPINRQRQDAGLMPANTVWPYGQGRYRPLTPLPKRFGITGALISRNLLLQGIAQSVGMSVLSPPEEGFGPRVAASRAAFKEGNNLVLLPLAIGGPDAADEVRQEMIERVDREVITPLLNTLQRQTEPFCLLCVATVAGQSQTKIPFLLYDAEREGQNNLPFDERSVAETDLVIEEGQRLLPESLR